MRRFVLIIVHLLIVVCAFAQTTSSVEEEIRSYAEEENFSLPLEVEYGTLEKVSVDASFYTHSFDVKSLDLFSSIRDNHKLVKKGIVNFLSKDANAVKFIRLLIATNREIKYSYSFNKKWQVDIVISHKELQKMLK